MESESRGKTTQNVLALVARAREALANLRPEGLNANGVFHHPATQLAAMKAARGHLDKAIALMEVVVDAKRQGRKFGIAEKDQPLATEIIGL